MKKVIAACIDRLYEFDTQEEATEHIEKLRKAKKKFCIVMRSYCNGKCQVRIQEQYNSSPMLDDENQKKG